VVAERTRERLIGERQSQGLSLEPEDVARIEALADQPVAEEKRAHAVAEGLDDAVGFRMLRLAEQSATLFFSTAAASWGGATEEDVVDVLPGVAVRNAAERLYPADEQTVVLDRTTFPPPLASEVPVEVRVRSVGADIVGSMRARVFKEDADARQAALASDAALAERSRTPSGVDRGRYFEGDSVGHSGIEMAREATLRGLRGLRTENLETRQVTERPPEPGRDVRLTIDAALQARVRAIFDPGVGLARVQPWQHNETLGVGTTLFGAAVVMDVQTGEVLAMVSTPAEPRDGDWSALGIRDEKTLALFRQVYHPEFNRAIGRPYPPGSIAKALILCGAVRDGAYAIGERIHDQGYLLDGRPDILRSWIYKQFGITHSDQLGRDPDGADALMVSANVFFFTLGQRLGAKRITRVYRDFGVGEGFGFGLGTEWPGKIGPFDGPGDGSDLEPWDAIQLGIGQGPATWTPMHAAAAYAAIARGGVYVQPRLVLDGSAPSARDLGIPPAAISLALDGLWGAVNDAQFGTGHAFAYEEGGKRVPIFNAPGVRVWGKTGTATASPIVVDPDGDGPAPASVALSGDHSWFLVLVGEERGPPRYVLSVLMEYAGSGGRVSGPIANQIIHALIDEGYLRGEARAEAGGGERP
jgi:penicillin-binding protein 2